MTKTKSFSVVLTVGTLAFWIAVSGALPGSVARADTFIGPNLDVLSDTGPLADGIFACLGGTESINPSPTDPSISITGINPCSNETISSGETVSFETLNGYALQAISLTLSCNVTGGDSLILSSAALGFNQSCPTQATSGTINASYTFSTPVTSGTFDITLSNTYNGGTSTLSTVEDAFHLVPVPTPEPSSLLLLGTGLLSLAGIAWRRKLLV